MSVKAERSKRSSKQKPTNTEPQSQETSTAQEPSSRLQGTTRPNTPLETDAHKLQKVTDLLSNRLSDDDEANSGQSASSDDAPEEEGVPPTPSSSAEPDDTSPTVGDEGTATAGDDALPDEIDPAEITDWTVTGLAEALGLDAKDIYEKLSFQLDPEGEPISLGAMKDSFKETQVARRETAQREADLNGREAALNRDMQVLQTVVDDLQGHLSKETVAQVRQRQADREARERQLMRKTMPELVDPNKFDLFRNDTVELMGRYGFKPHEVNITDHRMLLAIRDMLRLDKAVKHAGVLEKERTQQPPKAARPHGNRKASSSASAIKRARSASATEQDKAQGVLAVLSQGRR